MRTMHGFCMICCRNSWNFDSFDIQLFDITNSNTVICNIDNTVICNFIVLVSWNFFFFKIVNLLNILLDCDIISPVVSIFPIKSKIQRYLYYIFRLHNYITFIFYILKIYMSFHSFSYLHLIALSSPNNELRIEDVIISWRKHIMKWEKFWEPSAVSRRSGRVSEQREESIINSSWPCFCRFYFTAFYPAVRETKMKKKWLYVWVIYTCQRRFIARFMLHTRHPLKPTFACSGRSKNANWKAGAISFFRLA